MQYFDELLNEIYNQLSDILNRLMSNFSPNITGGATNISPYAILGLDSSASDDEIDSRYRYLMKCLHPDVCPGMHFLPVLINTAYHQIKKLRGYSHSP